MSEAEPMDEPPDPSAETTPPSPVETAETEYRNPSTPLPPASDPSHHSEVTDGTPTEEEEAVLPGVTLVDEIGTGGFGAVYRAVDEDFGREVAVKILRQRFVENTELRERFVSEALITGHLQHPNIVPVHRLERDSQARDFFTMKIMEGPTLEDVLERLANNDPQAKQEYLLPRRLQIFVDICNAVDYAHAQGIVHRDLKPANVMLGNFGEVYVLDWGLAKILKTTETTPAGMGPEEPDPDRRASLRRVPTHLLQLSRSTLRGAIMGTPGYMSPEQAAGKADEIDERSDVYSLGAILYEMLTLRLPVMGDTAKAIIKNTVAGAVLPMYIAAKGRNVPMEVAAIARKALRRQPEDRYQSVRDLARDVRSHLEDREVSVHPEGAFKKAMRWGRKNFRIAAMLMAMFVGVVLVAFGLLGLAYARARREARDAQHQVQRMRAQSGTTKEDPLSESTPFP